MAEQKQVIRWAVIYASDCDWHYCLPQTFKTEKKATKELFKLMDEGRATRGSVERLTVDL